MKYLMKSEFLPPDYEQILFQQYQRCQQGSKSVHEFSTDFMRLAERNNLLKSEGQQVARYLKGLKPALRDRIGVQVIRTLSEARNLALKAELMQQERGSRNYGGYRSAAWSKDKGKEVKEQTSRRFGTKGKTSDDKSAEQRPMKE